jgi:DNA-binding response OmpR family regulator
VPSPPRRRTVLVVEDDPDLRALYRSALSLAGYVVVAVADGIDALRHFDGDTPDAVVLDIGLPRLGGRDVQRELASHADLSSVPIIAVSGDVSGLHPKDFSCILLKPIDLDELLEAVARCVAK